jgi:hypothetical protein
MDTQLSSLWMFMYLDELKTLKQLTAPTVLFRPKSVLFAAKRSTFRLQTPCYELHNGTVKYLATFARSSG